MKKTMLLRKSYIKNDVFLVKEILSSEVADNIILSQELKEIDFVVMDAVYQVYLSKKFFFTTTELATIVAHNERPSKELLFEIEDSMHRLMGTFITINCESEMIFTDESNTKQIIEMGGTMIIGFYETIQNKSIGKTEDMYILMSNGMPLPLYDYAERISQIV